MLTVSSLCLHSLVYYSMATPHITAPGNVTAHAQWLLVDQRPYSYALVHTYDSRKTSTIHRRRCDAMVGVEKLKLKQKVPS